MPDLTTTEDRVRVVTADGSGYENPAKRDGAAVARDLPDGKTRTKTAKNIYGWIS